MSDGECDDLYAYVRRFAAATPISSVQAAVDLYFGFDCDNTSTYLFGLNSDFVSETKCTNIISTSLLGEDHTDEMSMHMV